MFFIKNELEINFNETFNNIFIYLIPILSK